MDRCIKCKATLPEGAVFCPLCGKKQTTEKRKSLKRANGTGTVYKLQGRRRKPWVAAKNKIVIGYYEKKTDALEALEQLSKKSLSERYNMTFSEVYDEWSKEHFRNVSPKSVSSYTASYNKYEPLHEKKFRTLRTKDFQAVVDTYSEMSYSTLSNLKLLAGQLSKWAMREEIITTNFASFIQLPPHEKHEKEIFSEEEIKLLEQDNSETAKIILMLIYTGMRINELFLLTIDNYHSTYVIGGEKTKSGKDRIIPIRPEGREYFKYFYDNATGQLLLSGYTGRKDTERFRASDYYPLLKKLGIKRKTPHCTRHTFASWAVQNNIKPEVLQKILGHSKYSTTADIYVHADIKQLVDAVEK